MSLSYYILFDVIVYYNVDIWHSVVSLYSLCWLIDNAMINNYQQIHTYENRYNKKRDNASVVLQQIVEQ